MNEFFTWEMLITIGGASILTGLITEFLKPLVDRYIDLPTQYLAYVIALIVLMAGLFFTGGLTYSSVALSVFNAIIIAGATSNTISAFARNKK